MDKRRHADDAGLCPHDEQSPELRRSGGEFRSRVLEDAFIAERASDNHGQARMLLIASTILNSLFFISDWRFAGTPHFWLAIPARAVVVLASALCLLMLGRAPSPLRRQRVLVGWMTVTGIAVGALVTSHSDIALFVAIMLPMIYYLAVPVAFRWTLAGGAGCSLTMLVGFEAWHRDPTLPGLMLAMLTLNVAMVIAVSRSNRLERLAWLSAHAERRSREALSRAKSDGEKMFTASPVPMVVTGAHDGRIVRHNESALHFFGGEVNDISIRSLYVDPDDRDQLLKILARDGEVRDFETRVRRADESIRTVLVRSTRVELADQPIIMSGFIDISDRKAAEQDLAWLASTDPLTGLPNRLNFFSTGRAEMMLAARTGAPLTLLMIDLDHFKHVNDSFGHAGGDEALRVFAATCRATLGDRGTVARLGGEEFVILLPKTDLASAVALAENLRQTVERMEVALRRGSIRLTASIGVARVDMRERELDAALARADQALYEAKHRGRNRVVVAGPETLRRVV